MDNRNIKYIGIVTAIVFLITLASCMSSRKSIPDSMEPVVPKAAGDGKSHESDAMGAAGQEQPGAVKAVSTPFGTIYQKIPMDEAKTKTTETSSTQTSPDVDEKIESIMEVAPEREATEKKRTNATEIISRKDGLKKQEKSNSTKSGLTLNFDNADLYEVIQTIAELLEINYIVDPSVAGKVTIHTAGVLSPSDLWPVFFQILEANGLTAVREGNLYHITQLKDAARLPILSLYGQEEINLPETERIVMQIVPLMHVDSAEMIKVLTPFISPEGTMISHEDPNTLLIVDKGVNVSKALRLIKVFDADFLDKTAHRFYFLKYADAMEITRLLEQILGAYEKTGKLSYHLITIERLNAILAIGSDERVFEKIDDYLQAVDIPSETAQKKIYVYSVKNGEAADLSTLLNTIFGTAASLMSEKSGTKQNETETGSKTSTGNPFMKKPTATGTPKSVKAGEGAAPGTGSGTLRGEVKITADEIRNAIIIEATASDYQIIEHILSRLDVLPRQVLIEVTIAEISLDDSTSLGVEWSYLSGKGTPGSSVLSATAGSAGLQFAIGETDRWSSALSSLASNKKANILATPAIMASDNKEAVINIANEIPVISSTYDAATGNNSNLRTTNVEYRNTGLILTVTPHINESGLVSLAINQELSEPTEGVAIGNTTYPSFFKRTVNTSLVVKNNQTIVIGGLMRETKSKGKSGVPILSKIPILGFLFGKGNSSFSKNELVILITPRVIIQIDDVDAVTEEFKQKVSRVVP